MTSDCNIQAPTNTGWVRVSKGGAQSDERSEERLSVRQRRRGIVLPTSSLRALRHASGAAARLSLLEVSQKWHSVDAGCTGVNRFGGWRAAGGSSGVGATIGVAAIYFVN